MGIKYADGKRFTLSCECGKCDGFLHEVSGHIWKGGTQTRIYLRMGKWELGWIDKNGYLCHKWGWSLERIEESLKRCGITELETEWSIDRLWVLFEQKPKVAQIILRDPTIILE